MEGTIGSIVNKSSLPLLSRWILFQCESVKVSKCSLSQLLNISSKNLLGSYCRYKPGSTNVENDMLEIRCYWHLPNYPVENYDNILPTREGVFLLVFGRSVWFWGLIIADNLTEICFIDIIFTFKRLPPSVCWCLTDEIPYCGEGW